MAPEARSSSVAQSRRLRVSMKAVASPRSGAFEPGAPLTRPREGLRPTRPQKEAGLRIEPPPSPPCAKGTIPAATAAAEPPLEPATPRVGSQGFFVAP